MTCSKQATHRKCKEGETGDTCASDMKQISIWLANKAGNKYQETKNRKNNLFKFSSQCAGIKQTR